MYRVTRWLSFLEKEGGGQRLWHPRLLIHFKRLAVTWWRLVLVPAVKVWELGSKLENVLVVNV